MLCLEWTLVKRFSTTIVVEPLKCKCWNCDYCNPIKRKQLMKKAFLGQPNTFLTLTVNPSVGKSPNERARLLARAWRHLRLRAKRRYKLKTLPFLAVFERTKRGEPHLHILLRTAWLSQRWLSDQMKELMNAPIVDIRRIDKASKKIAYVVKYIGKEPSAFPGTKRYWSSHDYDMPDPEEPAEDEIIPVSWSCRGISVDRYIMLYIPDGFKTYEQSQGRHSFVYERCPEPGFPEQ